MIAFAGVSLSFSLIAVIGGWIAFFGLMDVLADALAAQCDASRRVRFFARMRGFSQQR